MLTGGLLAAACASPPRIHEMAVVPRTVCPGEEVMLRVVAEDFEGGLITAVPAPVSGTVAAARIPASPGPWATDRPYGICAATTFEAKFWKGTEGDCTPRGMVVCRTESASVLLGAEALGVEASGCQDPFSPGTVTIEAERRDFSESMEVTRVVNCGARGVRLARDGGPPPELAEPGADFPAHAGQPWVGTWTASETVFGGFEGCESPPLSRVGETPPPPLPQPPPICLAFTLACPATDACEG